MNSAGLVDAAIRATKELHYARWTDEPVPALGGRTPRAAVAEPGGRPEVERLVAGIEQIEARARGAQRFDTASLRRTLGLPPASTPPGT